MDTCSAGVCTGTSVAGCSLYYTEGFESCPDNWTFGGDWQCGTPTGMSPVTPHTGHGVIATKLDGLYDPNQTYSTCVATSPSIDLTHATNPALSFWVWDQTEGGTFDGWNLEVSVNGQPFTVVTGVTPSYNTVHIAGEQAWGGDYSAEGWQNYLADLTPYVGQPIKLRFAFESDAATQYVGVYIDDIVVAEPVQIPLYISTSSPLMDVYAGVAYSAQLAKTGGSSGSQWSINYAASTKADWLTINPSSGLLTGTPPAADIGTVTLVVHLDEPTLPSNFADATFTFDVLPDLYYESWENGCPDGWTLTSDWQCGVPMNPAGPATAYVGTHCIGVGMVTDYSNLDTWAGTTATSPPIALTEPSPILTFRMWVVTEGMTYDGGNLQISTDGGMTWSVVPSVVPIYPLMIAGSPTEQAWGGMQSALGWQLVTVALQPWSGKTVNLRFAFESDSSNVFPGIYIDDFLIQ
jgi:hypothetical protein